LFAHRSSRPRPCSQRATYAFNAELLANASASSSRFIMVLPPLSPTACLIKRSLRVANSLVQRAMWLRDPFLASSSFCSCRFACLSSSSFARTPSVKRPKNCSSAPQGATAQCADRTYSFSQSQRGTCSHHASRNGFKELSALNENMFSPRSYGRSCPLQPSGLAWDFCCRFLPRDLLSICFSRSAPLTPSPTSLYQ
jgi:hypothetical protein